MCPLQANRDQLRNKRDGRKDALAEQADRPAAQFPNDESSVPQLGHPDPPRRVLGAAEDELGEIMIQCHGGGDNWEAGNVSKAVNGGGDWASAPCSEIGTTWIPLALQTINFESSGMDL